MFQYFNRILYAHLRNYREGKSTLWEIHMLPSLYLLIFTVMSYSSSMQRKCAVDDLYLHFMLGLHMSKIHMAWP